MLIFRKSILGIATSLALLSGLTRAAEDPAALFEKHRRAAESSGAVKIVSGLTLQRADEWARRAGELQKANRSAEAERLFREASWLLPTLPPDPPAHLSRIYGNSKLRHSGWVNCVAYNRDCSLLASASADGSVRIWDLSWGKLVRDFRGHGDRASAVIFMPDGKVASAGNKEIRIWDPLSGEEVISLSGANAALTCLACAPNGRQIVASGEDRTIRIWDVESGKENPNLGILSSRVHDVAWSRDGQFIAAVNGEGSLLVWDVTHKEPKKVLDQTRAIANTGAFGVCISPESKLVAICGERQAKLISLPSANQNEAAGAVRRTLDSPGGPTDLMTALAFSPDGKLLATGHRDRSVRIWNVMTGQLMRTQVGHSEEILTVAFAPDGKQLASGGQDQSIRLWDLEPQPPALIVAGHEGPVWTLGVAPDGRRFATAGADRSIRLWDTSTGQHIKTFTGHTRPVTAASFTPDGRSLVSAAGDNEIRIWPVDSAGESRALRGSTAAVLAIAIAADGRTLFGGGADRVIRAWDISNGKLLSSWPGHAAAITGIALRPDGQHLATTAADGVLKIWNRANGREMLSFRAHDTGGAAAVVYSPNGQVLATAGGDKMIKLWHIDAKSREPIASITAHSGPISTLAFHPNNTWLASGGADGVVKVWDIAKRSEILAFRGHTDWVTSTSFDPKGNLLFASAADGRTLAWRLDREADQEPIAGHIRKATTIAAAGQRIITGGDDNALMVWDQTTGRGTMLTTGQPGYMIALAASEDGKRLLSSGYDRKVRLWDLTQMKEERSFDSQDRAYAIVITPDGARAIVWQSREGGSDDVTSLIQQYDLKSGAVEDIVSEKGKSAKSHSFSADGTLAVVGTPSGAVRVWDLNSKSKLADDWPAHSKAVNDVAITPDKRHVISADQNGEIKVWRLTPKPGEPVSTSLTGVSALLGLAVAPDGQRVAAFNADGEIAVIEVANGDKTRHWSLRQRISGVTFTADGKHIATANGDGTVYVLDLP